MSVTRRDESPNERFRRLASIRTNSILNKLHLLGNLADTRNYQYSDKEVAKIFLAINTKLKETRAKFKNTKKHEFTL